jgi:hypothetical protein
VVSLRARRHSYTHATAYLGRERDRRGDAMHMMLSDLDHLGTLTTARGTWGSSPPITRMMPSGTAARLVSLPRIRKT